MLFHLFVTYMHICVPQINGKPLQYIFPHARLKLLRDPKDHTVSGKKKSNPLRDMIINFMSMNSAKDLQY